MSWICCVRIAFGCGVLFCRLLPVQVKNATFSFVIILQSGPLNLLGNRSKLPIRFVSSEPFTSICDLVMTIMRRCFIVCQFDNPFLF